MSSISSSYHCELPQTEWLVGESLIASYSETLSIRDLDENWFKVGEAANHLAQQIQGHYPFVGGLESTASIVANELLENLVKYGVPDTLAEIHCHFYTGYIEMTLSNFSTPEQAETFHFYLERLSGNLQSHKSLNRLFEEKITLSSMITSQKSELGMLMILKDYGAKLKIDIIPSNDMTVAVLIKIQLKVG